ncbi:MAG: bifunctional pyr operon transcriptional regulator/uracil phosphoribosyltransferase PyrR [Gammaproteobacteria bacterium]|nr:bifunctional pyr operon transcriptional regulator/uracil phosphoribosyltransferase PyrR [Gammaproteobacteria bacterium]
MNLKEQLDLDALIYQMAQDLKEYLRNRDITSKSAMVGIHTGGVWVAEKLHHLLGLSCALGVLDISFYRDDFTRVGLHPKVKPSSLPFDVNGRSIILVDDVIHTGRTIRAALNEIFDYGRPDAVILTALIEREGRELPIRADITGKKMTLGRDEYVKLSGPKPLKLTRHQVNE